MRSLIIGSFAVISLYGTGSSATNQASASPRQTVRLTPLTAPGSPPFHLKAVIPESGGSEGTQVEVYWKNPLQWRRTIKGDDFSQTLIVNVDKTFEEDSDDYFPVGLRTLVAAIVDAENIEPEFRLSVADFRNFKGKKVPQSFYLFSQYGGRWKAQITELTLLKNLDEELFAIPEATPTSKQIRVESLPETEFRELATETHEIIWPQPLDGAIAGVGRFHVSIDSTGAIREVYPVQVDNERAYESASRQIMAWKFKPFIKGGAAAQVESYLTFAMNTRAWGPPEPLSNEEVRKLASDIVEPVISSGIAPAGTVYTLRVAIDSDGRLIEVLAGKGPAGLFKVCYDAIKHWHFSPVLENGEPRPYRGEISFVVQ